MKYDAKSSSISGEPVSCKEHLGAVSALACKYGAALSMESEASLAGLLHDFGKYSESFQDVLYGGRTGIDHALPGAVLARGLPSEIAEAIAAHHSSLVSKHELMPYLRPGCVSLSGKCPSMCTKEEYASAKAALTEDFGEELISSLVARCIGEESQCDRTKPAFESGMLSMMRSRMLLSCLVDADWSVSAYEEDGDLSRIQEGDTLDASSSLSMLWRLHDEAALRCGSCNYEIRELRQSVWEACGEAGNSQGELFELSAPTGSGKTLGFFRFALERCAKDASRKRIVVALPFLSLTDQVYEVAREIVPGAILDTSNSDLSGESRELSSRWDAPCVVTTTVQLFGSLFSDRPGDVRKLHRLSDAVVVLDEVQAIPIRLQPVAMSVLNYLVREAGAVVLLSTATMPRIPSNMDVRSVLFGFGTGRFQDIAPAEGMELMRGEYAPAEIAQMVAGERCGCAIFNTKRQAAEAYDALVSNGVENPFLVTASTCPDHRREIVAKIAALIAAGEPVHVVATQCLEAGVDLDFEQVYRAIAPLPSLVQAAGRQNRGRKRTRSSMKVFVASRTKSGERLYPDSSYEKGAAVSAALFADGFDLSSTEALQRYFELAYSSDPTPVELADAVLAKNYASFARHSRLIEERGVLVIVPYNEELWGEALDAALSGSTSKREARRIVSRCGGTSVQAASERDASVYCARLCYRSRRDGESVWTGVLVLLREYRDFYADKGLEFGEARALVF